MVELEGRSFEPSPVPLNRGEAALDDAFRRDGWVAVRAFSELWGVPLPLEGKAFFIAKVGDWAVGTDERTMWFEEHREWEWPPEMPATVVEYDGVRRKARRTVELPLGLSLGAVVPQGLVLVDAFEQPQLHLLEWGARDATPLTAASGVRAAHGPLLLLERYGHLALFDVAQRVELPIVRPTAGDWDFGGSFSPSGRYFALSARIEPRPPEPSEEEREEPIRQIETGEVRYRYESKWSKLVIVDCADGSVRAAEGRFDNFATDPVWSDDGDWLVFAAPYQARRLWACNVNDARLEELRFRLQPPSPLANITGR